MSQFLINKQRFKRIKLKEAHYLLMINENKLKNQLIKKTIFLWMII